MAQQLVIIGAGFAGMYAALSAARVRDLESFSTEDPEIALVAPEPRLVVRPRLYEADPETLTAPLDDVLQAIDVNYVEGTVETIDTRSRGAGTGRWSSLAPRRKLSRKRSTPFGSIRRALSAPQLLLRPTRNAS